jgi:hypothetical protein
MNAAQQHSPGSNQLYLRDTDQILTHAPATLDFDQPIAVSLLMILMLVENPYDIVARLLDAVPSGSYLVISHPAKDVDLRQVSAYDRLNERMGDTQGTLRTHVEVAAFFDGLEMVPPGLVQLHRWRPDSPDADLSYEVPAYSGVGAKHNPTSQPGTLGRRRISPLRPSTAASAVRSGLAA